MAYPFSLVSDRACDAKVLTLSFMGGGSVKREGGKNMGDGRRMRRRVRDADVDGEALGWRWELQPAGGDQTRRRMRS